VGVKAASREKRRPRQSGMNLKEFLSLDIGRKGGGKTLQRKESNEQKGPERKLS